MDHHLDVTGLRCPVPLLMTARCVADLSPGDRLRVAGDDPDMEVDLRRWCAETGHELLELERDGRQVRCVLRKAGASPAPTVRPDSDGS